MNILKYKNYMILLLLLILIGITTRVILLNTQNEDSNDIFLTDEEKAWLDDHKDQIKIGYTIDYPPVEFLENGQYAGISADYFNLLEKKLGIDIQMGCPPAGKHILQLIFLGWCLGLCFDPVRGYSHYFGMECKLKVSRG
jgi:ABC-type amino acid transport substrate-binding protein